MARAPIPQARSASDQKAVTGVPLQRAGGLPRLEPAGKSAFPWCPSLPRSWWRSIALFCEVTSSRRASVASRAYLPASPESLTLSETSVSVIVLCASATDRACESIAPYSPTHTPSALTCFVAFGSRRPFSSCWSYCFPCSSSLSNVLRCSSILSNWATKPCATSRSLECPQPVFRTSTSIAVESVKFHDILYTLFRHILYSFGRITVRQ